MNMNNPQYDYTKGMLVFATAAVALSFFTCIPFFPTWFELNILESFGVIMLMVAIKNYYMMGKDE